MGGGGGGSVFEDVPLVEFIYLVFTRMPAERYRRRLMSVFSLFRALINSLVCKNYLRYLKSVFCVLSMKGREVCGKYNISDC